MGFSIRNIIKRGQEKAARILNPSGQRDIKYLTRFYGFYLRGIATNHLVKNTFNTENST